MAAKTASLSVNIIADAAKAKAGLREAETAFGKFRNSVGQADGAMGKFKATSGAALDFVKSNAMNFATAAGAAIVAFGIKSVKSFQDLALSVSKFSDATGMTLDSASRFIEVAGDIGIEAGTLEKSLGFMNKTMGNSPDLFKELGIQIEYTSGGAKDMSATFLNVIDRIKGVSDPAEKAALASKLLGRGWAEMAELIEMGSGSLTKSLSEVNDAQIITPEKERQAKALRDEMDRLTDSAGNFTKALGEKLTPVLTDVVKGINNMVEKAKDIGSFEMFGISVGDVANGLFKFSTAGFQGARALWGVIAGSDEASASGDELNVVTAEMARVWGEGKRAMIDAVPPAQNLNSEIERQQQVLEDAKYAWDLFKGNLSMELERQGLVTDIEAFRTKWAGTTDEAKRKSEEYRAEVLRLQIQVANFGGEVLRTATTATQNKIRILIETGQLERAVALLQYIRNNTLGYVQTPTATYAVTPYGAMPGRANGGIITKPEVSMVGEAGAEAIIPLTNPTRAMELMQASGLDMLAMSGSRGGGGSTVIQIQVDAGLVSSPDQVGQQIIEAIRRAERRSGQVFVAA